jgi:hypothetical protein
VGRTGITPPQRLLVRGLYDRVIDGTTLRFIAIAQQLKQVAAREVLCAQRGFGSNDAMTPHPSSTVNARGLA